MSTNTIGTCKFCGKEYTRTGMIKHLPACKKRDAPPSVQAGEKLAGYFSIVIAGTYEKEYWLMIEIREDSTLTNLDTFLRDIWLECCGHLSSFQIDNIRYDSSPEGISKLRMPVKSMRYNISQVLPVGMQFQYEYDFGFTTELSLCVFSYREGIRQKDKIIIMARNKPIIKLCNACGNKPATSICTQCGWEEKGFLCDVCSEKHTCGEDMLLPIVNSPRCGVCGYSGSTKYSDE